VSSIERARVTAIGVSLMLLSASVRASAQTTAEIPGECGSQQEFDREVRARLENQAAPLPTTLELEPEAGGYVLRMSLGGAQRELRERSCRELFRAAVVVAVAITLSEAKPKAASATPPLEGQKARDVAPAPANHQPEAELGSGFFSAVALGGGVHAGITPNLVPLPELEVRIGYAHFGAALGARYFPSSLASDEAGRGVDVSAVGGELSALFLPTEAWETRLGVQIFRLSGTGVGSEAEQSDAAWSAGLLAGAGFYPLRQGRMWGGLGVSGE
jgi:hypothetical protein